MVPLTESLEIITRNIIGLNNETTRIQSNIERIKKASMRIKLVNERIERLKGELEILQTT